MEKIGSMLVVPNLETPLNMQAANDYKKQTWEQKAKQWTQQYAK